MENQKIKTLFFITVLRALAACLITNAHYEGVYPVDLLANGGLLGDVLFFAVSGWCLVNVRGSFPAWYGKRLLRCYLPVTVITAVYFLLGQYDCSAHGLFWWFVYPTGYHFIASIVLLYIPYYFILRSEALRNRLPLLMGVLAVLCFLVYLFFYDRSYYHIDTVREPMILFLYMESMLLGALFRRKDASCRNRFSLFHPLCLLLVVPGYFASKLLFSRGILPGELQLLNWVALFLLLYFLFRTFCGLDARLEAMPAPLKRVVSFVASLTLEIYVVQSVLIRLLRPLLSFPVNWLVITAAILLSAYILHCICRALLALLTSLFSSIFKKVRTL